MEKLKFDFNNMFSHAVGAKHGVTDKDLAGIAPAAKRAREHIKSILSDEKRRIGIGLEWVRLPYQDKKMVAKLQRLGDEIAGEYENVISLGIGGSYLGLKAAQDALQMPYYNDFASVRQGRPRIYFDGNNLDPETLSALLGNLDPKKTFVIVISKSGETMETKCAFTITEEWLKKAVGSLYGRQIVAITDPASGCLRKKVKEEQAKDPKSFRSFPVIKGVGGRFSELNIGLLHLAVIGIDIQDVLDGAAAMVERSSGAGLTKNPALMYAALNTILYKKKRKPIAVMMPFSETLKSTAEWYVQLLAESLGKKYSRAGKIVNVGRTPIPSRGTNDLHSIQQNNIEGENNKTVTFIKVEKFRRDITLKGTGDFLEGSRFSRLLSAAEEATEWALVKESRPNCTLIMHEVTPFSWGELILFFEMATAYEGELLNVNAYDQPGVEGYKNYMYYKLNKPGMPEDVVREIRRNPLKKKSEYIL
ncbi:MAG: glucose-6-phosphate isomerase [Candidatus Omnitrophota bacterium]|nr:glucose-6-phosphate isomerase [Candidatus Omnitrophota bacterium]